MTPERIGVFVEYVCRPMVADLKDILTKAEGVISKEDAKLIIASMALWHVTGEVIRAFTYITITWIICQHLFPLLSL